MGSYSVAPCIRPLMGQTAHCLAADAGMWGDRGCGDGSPPYGMTQQRCLASTAAWLSSTIISHHSLLPHVPSISLFTVNSSPCTGIVPQSLHSSSQPLSLLGDLHPGPGYVWLWQGLSDSLSIYVATDQLLSASNVSPLTQTIAWMWGSDPCFSCPTC